MSPQRDETSEPGKPPEQADATSPSGEAPEGPSATSPPGGKTHEATTPPGQGERDEDAIKKAEEELERAGGGH